MGPPSRNLVYSFVPSDHINLVVLDSYLKRFLDNTATIRPSRHPKDSDKVGYTVGAARVLGREELQDIITDSNAWDKEQNLYQYQDSPYDYLESDTWEARKRRGQTPERKDKMLDGASVPSRHAKGVVQQINAELEDTGPPSDPKSAPDPVRYQNGESRHVSHPQGPRAARPSDLEDRAVSQGNNLNTRHKDEVDPSDFTRYHFTPHEARPYMNGEAPKRRVYGPRISTEPSDQDLRNRWWHDRANSVEVTLKKPSTKRKVNDTITAVVSTIVIDDMAQSSFIRALIPRALEATDYTSCNETYVGASNEQVNVLGLLQLEVSWSVNGNIVTEHVTFRVVKDLSLPIIMSIERAKHLDLIKVAKPVRRALVADKIAPITIVPSASLPKASDKDKQQNTQVAQQTRDDNKKRDDVWDARKRELRRS